MARMRSKRHRQEREEYMLKEQKKVDQGIFDTQTMVYLSKFFNKGIVSKLEFIIARGKEADLYLADSGKSDVVNGEDVVVLKFFRIEASAFLKMSKYIIGDPRFSRQIGKSRKFIINTWCKKEFGNLRIASIAGVHVPRPYMFNGNIIAMEFIGDEGKPAPAMKDVILEDPETIEDLIIEGIRKMYIRKLVHGDVSEFNILIRKGIPYFIDFGQAVVTRHPNANEFLVRDVKNTINYFWKNYKVKKDFDEVYKYIVSDSSDM